MLKPSCHPDRKYKAKDLCNACYLRKGGYSKRWYEANKEKQLKYSRRWAKKNPEKRREVSRLSARKAYQANPRKYILYTMRRLRTNLNYRLAHYARARLRSVLKGLQKSAPTLVLLGCSIEELKKHLAKQFKKGMSWKNYGKWHIDHIRPCASFDLSKPSAQRKCFHYSNLQPLWAFDNLSKGDKYE